MLVLQQNTCQLQVQAAAPLEWTHDAIVNSLSSSQYGSEEDSHYDRGRWPQLHPPRRPEQERMRQKNAHRFSGGCLVHPQAAVRKKNPLTPMRIRVCHDVQVSLPWESHAPLPKTTTGVKVGEVFRLRRPGVPQIAGSGWKSGQRSGLHPTVTSWLVTDSMRTVVLAQPENKLEEVSTSTSRSCQEQEVLALPE
ncbi:unnamed protein product [Amoebophrya sp. A25]|nr:unnamed protein product [Amoebophrya sp. A25]|eukprot:GSA25T00025103001.1